MTFLLLWNLLTKSAGKVDEKITTYKGLREEQTCTTLQQAILTPLYESAEKECGLKQLNLFK